MKSKQFIIAIWLIVFTVGFIVSCNKKEDLKPEIRVDKIVIDSGRYTFQDSLIILVNDTLQYEISFETEPKDAEVYYLINSGDFIKLADDRITIDSTFNHLYFYLQRQGYRMTEVHKIDFGFGNDNLIPNIRLYPNPFTENLNFTFNSKNIRGQYFYHIFNLKGEIILTQNDFVSGDTIEKSIELKNLPSGIYLMQFNFGNSTLTDKIVKK